MVVALNYHRRHGLNCVGKHAAGTYSSEPEERKKGWARCRCLIYASGSLNRVARRFATKQADWQAAAQLMAPYIAANSWELPEDSAPVVPIQPSVSVAPAQDGSLSIPAATAAYLAE